MTTGSGNRSTRTYHIISVIFVHLSDAAVDQWLQAISLAVDDKLSLSSQSCYRQQNVFDKGEDAILLNHLRGSNGLADLLGDDIGGVQEVDLAVCLSHISIKSFELVLRN